MAAVVLAVSGSAFPAEHPDVEPYSIVVLPDSQASAATDGVALAAQAQWIVDNAERLNVQFVLHEGDVVNDTCDPAQWDRALAALGTMQDAGIPFAISPGNHDIIEYAPVCRDLTQSTVPWDTHFAPSVFSSMPTYGGVIPGTEAFGTLNTWHTFTASGLDHLVLAIQFGPTRAVLDAAAAFSSLPQFADDVVLVVTHDYIGPDGQPRDYAETGPTGDAAGRIAGQMDGKDIHDFLVRQSDTVQYVFSGHVAACHAPLSANCSSTTGVVGRSTSTNRTGGQVHQVLANYQSMSSAAGYLRVMTFFPQRSGEPVVRVQTIDAVTGAYLTDPGNRFFLRDSAPYPFPDSSGIFNAEVTLMAERGVITGYANGKFSPMAQISRQAAAAMIWRTWGEPSGVCPEAPFLDVPADHPFCWPIARMKAEGFLSPGSHFRPADPVSRQAFAAFMIAPVPWQARFGDVPAGHPFAGQITAAYEVGLISGYGDGQFKPAQPITRQAAAAMVARLYFERRI